MDFERYLENEQDDFHSEAALTLQQMYNYILFDISRKNITTKKQLLLILKRLWRYLDYQPFLHTTDYVVSQLAIMDEALKLFTALHHGKLITSAYQRDILVVCVAGENSEDIEAWLWVDSTERNERNVIDQSESWLYRFFPNNNWRLTGVEPKRKIYYIRRKINNASFNKRAKEERR
ncbi:hypothetical protein [Alteribacillus iranensis]|uniref:Uncharacterized protein n=1 Tax=Alteribacillus iranensis TaxID=930128 RepID=A0A1I2EYG5_9BACI|nr:hypothetical protein [Alteribacillus iranensis]SFE97280.1 hypothetical protein SAMN05192532_10755 [Alteribacillus iranensis]